MFGLYLVITREIKYVDFIFVPGADGVKWILRLMASYYFIPLSYISLDEAA